MGISTVWSWYNGIFKCTRKIPIVERKGGYGNWPWMKNQIFLLPFLSNQYSHPKNTSLCNIRLIEGSNQYLAKKVDSCSH